MVWLNENQTELQVDIQLESSGPHVYLVIYHTTSDRAAPNASASIEIELASEKGITRGHATLYDCKYNMLCRQAVADVSGRIAPIDAEANFVSIKLNLNGSTDVIIHSIVAVPAKAWNDEHLVPKSTCIQIDGKCRNTTLYEVVPNSVKIEFDSSDHRQVSFKFGTFAPPPSVVCLC